MPNLRILHDNAADRAVLTASSQAGALGPANLQRDTKGAVLRASGLSQTITATWPTQECIACVALIFTNVTSGARMRVRGYERLDGSVPAIDTGWMMPCPEAPLESYPFGELPLGWNAYKWGSTNTWARGGGADCVAWFPPAFVRRLIIDVSCPDLQSGYIEMSRLVAGNYWSPEHNAEYGASLQLQDTTEVYRTASGMAKTAIGVSSEKLSVSLGHLAADDRARLMRILRDCGPVRPLLFSLFPENPDPLLEQDHMIYGRVTNLDAVSTPYYETYSAPLQIEGI